MELKTIIRDLSEILSVEELDQVKFGEYLALPNVVGCFQRKNAWFAYQNDEKAVCMITGPFDIKGIVIAIAKILHKKGLQFENEQQRMNYINNHFRSFAEIDSYQIANNSMNRF